MFVVTLSLIEFCINLIVWGSYGMALLAPYVSPKLWEWPAFFNMMYPLLLVVTGLSWGYNLLRKNWKSCGIYFLLLLFSVPYIKTYIPYHSNSKLSHEKDIRVLTFNVMLLQNKKKEKTPPAVQLIRSYNPDIICLQECPYSNNPARDYTKLHSYFGDNWPYIYPDGKAQHAKGVAIASRYPILYTEDIPYPTQGNGSCLYILQLPEGKRLLVVNNHMESYSLTPAEKKSYKTSLKELSLKTIPRLAYQLQKRLGPALELRAEAARRVAKRTQEVIQQYNVENVIVCGDFNDLPMSYTYHTLKGELSDAYAHCGKGLGVSYNEKYFPFRIDHLFYSSSLEAIGVLIPPSKNCSDHNPLIVDLKYR